MATAHIEVPVGRRGHVALIDVEDYDLVSQYKWFPIEPKHGRSTYAITTNRKVAGKWRQISMHQLITNYPRTDHINRTGLDNRRENLRPATPVENTRNRAGDRRSSSGFKGVSWSPVHNKWRARIKAGPQSRDRVIGLFQSEIEAAIAYDIEAVRLFGEFAVVNFAAGVRPDQRLYCPAEVASLLSTPPARRETKAQARKRWATMEPLTTLEDLERVLNAFSEV